MFHLSLILSSHIFLLIEKLKNAIIKLVHNFYVRLILELFQSVMCPAIYDLSIWQSRDKHSNRDA